MYVSRHRVSLAALGLGALLTSTGGLEAYQLFRRISLQLQGNCDWIPCATDGTYLALGLFLAFAVIGVILLALAVRRLWQQR